MPTRRKNPDSFAKADVTIKCIYTGVSNYVNIIMVKINYEIRIVTEEFSASLDKIYRNNIVISDNNNNNNNKKTTKCMYSITGEKQYVRRGAFLISEIIISIQCNVL